MTHKLIKTVLILLLFASCDSYNPDATKVQNVNGVKISTYEIEGCEYIGNLTGDLRSIMLTHKGNCKNPKHDTQTN